MSDTALRTPRDAPPPPPSRAAVPRRSGRGSAWARRRDRRGLWFITPFLVAFGLFTVVPLLYAIYESLFTTRIIGGTVFSGFSNYRAVLTSGPFWGGFARVVIFGAIQIPVMLVVAFFFATVFDLGWPGSAGCSGRSSSSRSPCRSWWPR